MIVTKSEIGYTVEQEDGTTVTTAELPKTFQLYRHWIGKTSFDSWEFASFKRRTKRKFKTLDDFCTIGSMPEYKALQLTSDRWCQFYLTCIQQLDPLLRSDSEGFSNSSSSEDEIIRQLIKAGKESLAEEWEDWNYPPEASIFDYAGIKQYLRTLTSIEDRIDFLKAVIAEMSQPCSMDLVNIFANDSSQPPQWQIQLEYRHALFPVDMSRLKRLRDALDRKYPGEVLRETGFFTSEAIIDDETELTVSEPEQQPIESKRQVQRLKWIGGQMDLVYLIDRLKAVGLLAPTTTDADVIAHFDFGGKAEDMGKSYRNMRSKLKQGTSHPNQRKYGILVSLFQDRVKALPVPEDLKDLLSSPDRRRKR